MKKLHAPSMMWLNHTQRTSMELNTVYSHNTENSHDVDHRPPHDVDHETKHDEDDEAEYDMVLVINLVSNNIQHGGHHVQLGGHNTQLQFGQANLTPK